MSAFKDTSKLQSLSFNRLPAGSQFTLRVLDTPKLLQSTDFTTQKPKFWNDDPTQPVMAAVVNVLVLDGPHSVGEERTIWATKPSPRFTAISLAEKDAGQDIDTDGILTLTFVGETPNKNPRLNNIKNYVATYKPPTARAFAQPEAGAQPVPPVQTPTPGMQTYATAQTPRSANPWKR